MTPPLTGTVLLEDGAPAVGATVTVEGAPTAEGRAETLTDAAGHYDLPSVQANPTLHTTTYVTVNTSLEGYLDAIQALGAAAGDGPVRLDFRLRRGLALYDQLDVLLTEDDPDYGYDGDENVGLPGKRGPVKVVHLKPTTTGPLDVTATWSGPDRLGMWVEKTYLEVSFEAVSAPDGNHLSLSLPAGWANDVRGMPLLTVGLRGPRGLLSGPTPIHLSMTPAK